MDEAKKQKWDPSVQGLVAFPQVLQYLTQNTNWTTQLGNALQSGDIIIDGGNSFYQDDVRRAKALKAKGITGMRIP